MATNQQMQSVVEALNEWLFQQEAACQDSLKYYSAGAPARRKLSTELETLRGVKLFLREQLSALEAE